MFTKARVAGMAVVAAVAVTAPIQAGYGAAKDEVTIKAVLDGKVPAFTGPASVERGAKLTFLNDSDPKKIGPHTITLVEKKIVPVVRSRKDADKCFEEGLCGAIAVAHKFDFKKEVVNKPDVDVGRKGAWDDSFESLEDKGDSFYTEEEGATETRKVIAPVGSRLTLFCAVHPEMVKTIKVVE